MESKAPISTLTKSKVKRNINSHVAECVRQFELPQQFPSTISELQKRRMDTSSPNMQARVIPSIISTLPLSGKIKFVPHKILPLTENLQKIKVKSMSGKDLEQFKKSEEIQFTKTVQLSKNEQKLSPNTTQDKSQDIRIQRIFPRSSKVWMVRKDDQVLTPGSEETLIQYKSVKARYLGNQMIKTNSEQVIIQHQATDSPTMKRNSSCLDESKCSKNKKHCQATEIEDSQKNENLNERTSNVELGDFLATKNSVKQTICAAAKKNIMVIVPNKNNGELKFFTNYSSTNNEEALLNDSRAILSHDNGSIESNNLKDVQISRNKNVENQSCKNMVEPYKSLSNDTVDAQYSKSENLSEKFSILEKAVLSVQDVSLRAMALEALNDCGIKTKKTVSIKYPAPTKIINESAVQTNVFSLMKEGEFLEADESHENLIKIKSNCNSANQPISDHSSNTAYMSLKKTEYEKDLNSMIDRIFQKNKNVSDVKNAFTQNKRLQAKQMLEQLQKDFAAVKNYDENGYLGIHRAVANRNLQDVQKQILILKAAKQCIDVCTQDGQTSLELAVELEVNSQIIRILLENGAQPVSTKSVHDSALILAAKKSLKVLPLLLNYINCNQRVLLNSKNSEGFAAIHYCAQNGNLEGIKELIRLGADVNLQDERSGRTALFYAVDTQNFDVSQEIYNEIAQTLIDNGAVSNIPTFSKYTVLSLVDDVKSHKLKIALNRAVK